MELNKRATCYDSYYHRYYTCNSGWYLYGRWVVFAIIVFAAFLIFFLFACLSARRRRRRGLQPFRGTGWAGRGPMGPAQPYYNPEYNHQQTAPPPYGPQGGYYGNQPPQGGYFGGQPTQNVELQQPPNTYRGGDNVYEPPAGPPPGKKGHTIR